MALEIKDERRRGADRRSTGKTRVIIVDGHTLFRRGVRNILELEQDIEVIGEAATGREALAVIEELTPDVVLMDLSIPAPNGIETTQRLKRELPHTGVIVLASNDDEDQLFDAIKAGAAAYVLKDIDPADLIAIIRRVRSGEYLINDKVFSKPAVASRVLKEFRELAVEILDNIAQGMTNKQVAYALSISEQTVKNHMSSILRKLSVNDRTQAVVYAMRQGWIKIPED
jgi:DNA-binding NarL/FixJ family response regulator